MAVETVDLRSDCVPLRPRTEPEPRRASRRCKWFLPRAIPLKNLEAVSYAEFETRQASRTGDPHGLKLLFAACWKTYWVIYDANPEFWQAQFTRKSLIASGLVRFAALVLSQSGRSDSSTRLLQHLASKEPHTTPCGYLEEHAL